MGLISPVLKAQPMSFTPAKDKIEMLSAISSEGHSENDSVFELKDTAIKVIGVGNCGCNAVSYMIENGLQKVPGLKFIAINTDAQALKRNKAPTQFQIDASATQCLSADAIPVSADEDRARIAEMISGTNMVFIIAGMGGNAGTGVAPVVAKIARDMGILTVAVVTTPFAHEIERMDLAQAGIKMLTEHVDSTIVVSNEKIMTALGDAATMPGAILSSNSVLHSAVAGIAEVINVPGLVSVDFADVRTLMLESGKGLIGSASATGKNRAQIAAENALTSTLLKDANLKEARGVFVNITTDNSLMLKEYRDITNTVQLAFGDATVLVGSVFDDGMYNDLRVTLVATGLG